MVRQPSIGVLPDPVLAQLGGLDVLIHDAGITYPAAFVDTRRAVVVQRLRNDGRRSGAVTSSTVTK
jgi:NAD(P)-dependent dehydrogenase (short-subunit alcohol dehydrogenase family)